MLNIFPRISVLAIIGISLLFANPTTSNNSKNYSLGEPNSPKQSPSFVVFEAKITAKKDDRAKLLKKFLSEKNSPMARDSEKLVKIADKYNLDWKLLPAIAGVESHYGQAVPSGSYNPYGWNNGSSYFQNWLDASEIVASGIRARYAPSGVVTPGRIGPSYAANPTWASHVVGYMQQIDQI